MRLDPEIDKVEARIVRRRHELARVARQSSQQAQRVMASPGALIGAAVAGFLAGGGAHRHHDGGARSGRRRGDPAARSAKRAGIAGVVATGAMWLVRARFGSPAGLAHYLMSRWRRREATAGRHVRH